jgi:4-carboxymuconolactone decarboxylase
MSELAARPAPLTEAAWALNRITGAYSWGATWTRPGLALPSRCLGTMTCRAALGREGPRRSHIRGARHIGCTQEQVIEVFLHMTFYGGIAFARGAIDMANDVFVNG